MTSNLHILAEVCAKETLISLKLDIQKETSQSNHISKEYDQTINITLQQCAHVVDIPQPKQFTQTKIQPTIKKKQHRKRYSKAHLNILNQFFANNPFPSLSERETLALQLNTTVRRIQIWFQNRRSLLKKKNK